MTRDEATQAAWTAYRLGKAGLTQHEFAAVLRIAKLNRRATRAWERLNTCEGREPECSRADRANTLAQEQAAAEAAEYGWTLDRSGGLWWALDVGKADWVQNALSGIL